MPKTCAMCGERKSLAAFHKNRVNRDGRGPYCKPCHSERNARWHAANRERVNAKKREQRRGKPEKWAHYNAKAAGKRHRVWYKVWYALKTGEITRPERCEMCGAKRRLDAHHADYRSWRKIRWLCRPCHALVESKWRKP